MRRRASRIRFRPIYRLVNDVCEAGGDPRAWTDRLMRGLSDLFSARVVGLVWSHLPAPGESTRAEVELHFGWTDEERRAWADHYWRPGNGYRSEFLRRLVSVPARFVTVRRQDLMDDPEWYALPDMTVHRACNVDANLSSTFVAVGLRRLFGIGVHRAWGAPQFTVRERQELRLVHLELMRAWRRRIALPQDQDAVIQNLPERLRQVLWLLCLGRSEKQIAGQLDLRPSTVHNHVTRLYRELKVHSRGELLSRAFRAGGSRPPALPGPEMNQFHPAV
jgi:DNA-binding CsgD family transcriptional regulator